MYGFLWLPKSGGLRCTDACFGQLLCRHISHPRTHRQYIGTNMVCYLLSSRLYELKDAEWLLDTGATTLHSKPVHRTSTSNTRRQRKCSTVGRKWMAKVLLSNWQELEHSYLVAKRTFRPCEYFGKIQLSIFLHESVGDSLSRSRANGTRTYERGTTASLHPMQWAQRGRCIVGFITHDE